MDNIQAGSLVTIRINASNNRVDPPVLFNPSGGAFVTITAPTGTVVVNLGAMTAESTGIFTYSYQSATDAALGPYTMAFKYVDTSGTTLEPATVGFVLVNAEGVVTTPGDVVDIINAETLLGATWAAPGAIGSLSPNSGVFTALSASTSFGLPSVARASLPAAGTAGRLSNVTDDVRGIWSDTGREWIAMLPVVDVARFATGGSGTEADPWTGWDSWMLASTTLNDAGGILAGVTTITLTSTAGFPVPRAGMACVAILNASNRILYTGISGNDLTGVLLAQDQADGVSVTAPLWQPGRRYYARAGHYRTSTGIILSGDRTFLDGAGKFSTTFHFNGSAVSTTLDGGVSAGATSITVVSTANFPDAGELLIEGWDLVIYTAKTATQFLGVSTNRLSAVMAHSTGMSVVSVPRVISFDRPFTGTSHTQVGARGFAITGNALENLVGLGINAVSIPQVTDIAMNGLTGIHNIGLKTKGHEFGDIGRLDIAAETPISIEQNPYNPINLDLDHFHFHDLYLLPSRAQTATSLASNVSAGASSVALGSVANFPDAGFIIITDTGPPTVCDRVRYTGRDVGANTLTGIPPTGPDAIGDHTAAGVAATGVKVASTSIRAASGVVLTTSHFDGYQGWVGNADGFQWIDTDSVGVGYNLSFRNVRHEPKAPGAGQQAFNIQHNHNFHLLSFYNCQGGGVVGNGIRLRKVLLTTADSWWYDNASGVVLDLDSTCGPFVARNFWAQSGATITATGLVKTYDGGKSSLFASAISPDFTYDNPASGARPKFSSLGLLGSAGAGFFELPEQSAAPSTPTNALRLYTDAANALAVVNESGGSALKFAGNLTLLPISNVAQLTLGDGTGTNPSGQLRMDSNTVTSTSGLGLLRAYNWRSGAAVESGRISFNKEGAGADDKAFIAFNTHNGTSLAERARMSSAGGLALGSTVDPGVGGFVALNSNGLVGANSQKYELKRLTEVVSVGDSLLTKATTIQIPTDVVVKAVQVRVLVQPNGTSTMTVTATGSGTVFQKGASMSTAAGTTDPGNRPSPPLNTNGVSAQTVTFTFNTTTTGADGSIRVDIIYELSTPAVS
jgi:hypothetical protein